VSVMPTSKNPLAVKRAFALGLTSFLNKGNIEVGILPLDVAVGGGCGGLDVGGGWLVGLNVAFKSRPRAYASGAACSTLTVQMS